MEFTLYGPNKNTYQTYSWKELYRDKEVAAYNLIIQNIKLDMLKPTNFEIVCEKNKRKSVRCLTFRDYQNQAYVDTSKNVRIGCFLFSTIKDETKEFEITSNPYLIQAIKGSDLWDLVLEFRLKKTENVVE